MKFAVVLQQTEEGFAIHCPALRGCWSQGKTEEEALINIKDAIRLYLETLDELTAGQARQVRRRRFYRYDGFAALAISEKVILCDGSSRQA